MNILITGATGFVGNAILKQLRKDKEIVLSATARSYVNSYSYKTYEIQEIDGDTDWSKALKNQEVVIHCAARVHRLKDRAQNPLEEYRRVNAVGTTHLAFLAAKAGVKRFVFISSIKVNGEFSEFMTPFSADDLPKPRDNYALSKLEAEENLKKISKDTGMEVVIIRPPLVYGLSVKGNFSKLAKAVQRGIPLPFGAIKNKRSMVAIDNLVDLVITCINHPMAANEIFLVSDDNDLSTAELISRMSQAFNTTNKLYSVPERLLLFLFMLLRRKEMAQRLCQSLQVDITKTKLILGWRPIVSVDEGLRRCLDKTLKL